MGIFSEKDIKDAMRAIEERGESKADPDPDEAEAKAPDESPEPAAEPAAAAPEPAEEAPKVEAKPADDARKAALRERVEAESRLRQKEIALLQREEAVKRAEHLEKLAKEDPLSFLQETGQDIETLNRQALQTGKGTKMRRVDSEVDVLKQKIAEMEQRTALAEQDRRRTEALSYVKDFVAKSKYDLVRELDASAQVFSEIESHYNETGELISEDEACQRVEARLDSLSEKLLKSEKVRAKIQPQQKATTKETKTLTNKMASPSSGKASESSEDFDWSDRDARIQHFLKKYQETA